MKLCSEVADCVPVCNHCLHMKGWVWDRGLRSYKNGLGYCELHQKDKDPASMCEDFHCFHADSKQEGQK